MVGLATAHCKMLWCQFALADVYALNALFCAALLAVMIRPNNQHQDLFKAALILGLGLSNHHTILLMAAPVSMGMLAGLPRSSRRPRLFVKGCALGLLGLFPYLGFAIRANQSPHINWGAPYSFSRFLMRFSGNHYGRPWGGVQMHAPIPQQLASFLSSCADQWGPVFLLFVLLGAGFLMRKSKRMGLTVIAAALICGPLVSILVVPGFDAEALEAISVFYVPVFLILALWLGLGLYRILLPMGKVWRVVALLVISFPILRNSSNFGRRVNWIALDHARDLLMTTSRRGLLFTSKDRQRFPVAFAQSVEGRAPQLVSRFIGEDPYDPLWMSPPSLQSESQRLERQRTFVKAALAEGLTVTYLTHLLPIEIEDVKWAPYGLGYRNQPLWMPTQERIPLWNSYTGPSSSPMDLGDRMILHDYHLSWGVTLLDEGFLWRAIASFDKALLLVKGIQSTPNTVGLILLERDEPELAVSFFEQSLVYDQKYVPARMNLGRTLLSLGRKKEAIFEFRRVLHLEPKNVLALNELGQAYAAMGKYKEALSVWKYSLSIDPDQEETRTILNRLSDSPI